MSSVKERVDYTLLRSASARSWYGLKSYDIERDIYSSSVTPLNEAEMSQIRAEMDMSNIQDANRNLLELNSEVAVFMDARMGATGQGFIGDMLQSTRIITALVDMGKKVSVIASHPDIFTGFGDQCTVIPIPPDLDGKPFYPTSYRMREYLAEQVANKPLLFPLNAKMPVVIDGISADGLVTNQIMVDEIRRVSQHKRGFDKNYWSDRGLHQLHALQIYADIIGIPGASQWKEFPSGFIHPAPSARQFAHEVVGVFDCLPKQGGIPIYIHPGVATDGNKEVVKFYPEKKWNESLTLLATPEHLEAIDPLIFIVPNNPDHARKTMHMYAHAKSLGFRTAIVPLKECGEYWSLGAFAAFLQELKPYNGFTVSLDSMPAHLSSILGLPTVVISNKVFAPEFFCPDKNSLILLPPHPKDNTVSILPSDVANGIATMLSQIKQTV